MMKVHAQVTNRRKAGFSLIEVALATVLLVMFMAGAMTLMGGWSKGLQERSKLTASATRTQEMLNRIERQLTYANGLVPETTLTVGLSAGVTSHVEVALTDGFPDRGILLIDRGTGAAERVLYTNFDPATRRLQNLTRALQCTDDGSHVAGASVRLAALANPIDPAIVNPTPNQFDGRANEITGPVFFVGDGTGFVFQVPTDPNGGTNFLDGGQVTWGATVAGQASLDGCSTLFFQPNAQLTEVEARTDLNRDGDLTDTYDLGKIVMRTWNQADPAQPVIETGLCPDIVLQEQCNWGGDLDGDGFDDPMFLWDPEIASLHIRLTIFDGTVADRAVWSNVESTIYLRNAP